MPLCCHAAAEGARPFGRQKKKTEKQAFDRKLLSRLKGTCQLHGQNPSLTL